MNEATLGLARAAVASPHWRWLPGMLATHSEHAPARVLSVQADEYAPPMLEIAWAWRNGDGVHPRGWLPDLEDPATLGCLLALVREAWGADAIDVRIDIAPRMDGVRAWWTARDLRMRRLGSGTVQCVDVDVRVACYVSALLSAPAQEVDQ